MRLADTLEDEEVERRCCLHPVLNRKIEDLGKLNAELVAEIKTGKDMRSSVVTQIDKMIKQLEQMEK